MSSVIIAGNTSGTITLDAPNVAGTTTLTLPTTSGTIITTGNIPTGSVLQIVNATYSTQVTNNTATYADTGLTASITPSSASNKILVLVNQSSVGKNTGLNSNALLIKLVRNSTDIIFFGGAIGYTETNIYNLGFSPSTSYLDSPATTSSVTYKTQFANGVNNAGVRVQTDGYTSTITLMEIKA
jgi:hypothetical protein